MATEVERARRLFTLEEYERMVHAGVFGPEDRLELIEGEIVVMSPIEVADSSLRYDRTAKLRVYARAGVPEYCIVETERRTIEVCREPRADGYRVVDRVGPDGVVAPLAFPDLAIRIGDVFA